MKKCPKCKSLRQPDRFHCKWCDECQHKATDDIMRAIGYVIVFCHQDLIDDAEERWESAWKMAMGLPKDYPDYAALCDALSNICPVPGVN